MSITIEPTITPITGELRTPIDKLVDEIVLERVKAGMAVLEAEHGPDWVDKIDLRELDLKDGHRCVLGQVYGDYSYAVESLHEKYLGKYGSSDDWGVAHGFTINHGGWGELQETWEDVLRPMISRNGG